MKKILTLLLLLIGTISQAQTTYSDGVIPYNPDPFTAGIPIFLADDQYSGVITMPFSFCFYDGSYNQLLIGSNGIVTFDLANANAYCTWPINATAPGAGSQDQSIMSPWQDIDPSNGGTIKYAVNGVAPFRRFVVSFYQIPMYSCTSNLFSQQVILYESTNIIEVHILNKYVCSWNGGNGIMGLEKDNTTGHIVAGRNYPSQWTTSNEGWRFTPITGPCVGAAQGNSVSGKVYSDNNNNCLFDGGDVALVNRPVLANSGAYYDWTDASGDYTIPLDTGIWAITSMPPLYWGPQCPAGGVYNHTFSTFGNTIVNDNFADTILFHCSDLLVDIGTANFTRCLNEYVGVNYCNQGTEPDSAAVVTVTLIDSLTLDSASIPYTSLGGNAYSFNVGILAPGACDHFNLYVSVGCDSVGVVYCMEADITGSNPDDCDTTNNHGEDCHALIASVDPNGKYVASQDFSTNGWVTDETIQSTDELSYMVTFQNTGNDTAFTVRIMDTLSTNVDPATVQPGAASANYNWVVIGNVVIFEFQNILLPDSNTNEPASHGFVKFRVNQTPGNIDGTHIINSVAIYFDQNAPVITNATDNFICDNPPVAAASITVTPSQYCVGDVVTLTVNGGNAGPTGTWNWNENDCNSGVSAGTGATLTYTITGLSTVFVHASNVCGESECTSINLTPQAEPLAVFSFTTSNGTATFTDASTGNTSWAWTFGDLGTSTQQNPVHNYTSSGTYTVTLIVSGPCGNDTTIQSVNVTVTEVNEAMMAAVKVYPNPNSGQFFVELPANAGKVTLSVADATGRVILERIVSTSGRVELNLNEAQGFYFLTIQGETFRKVVSVAVK
jgi:uncharacterized repeat protein (TIGR01451 family)